VTQWILYYHVRSFLEQGDASQLAAVVGCSPGAVGALFEKVVRFFRSLSLVPAIRG
jgi:hypothetical protein